MRKILTIAGREYRAMVGTKAFILGLAMMPVLMLGGMWVPGLLKGMQKSTERHIAVIDHSGQLFPLLSAAAEQKNQVTKLLQQESEAGKVSGAVSQEDRERNDKKSKFGLEDINTYKLESVASEDFDDEQRLKLSQRIRDDDLYAFVEIPAGVLNPEPVRMDDPDSMKLPEATYYSQDAALSDAKRWLQTTLNQLLKVRRLTEAGIAPDVIIELERRVDVAAGGLFTRDDSGAIVAETKPDELTSMFLPMGIMMLMFMIVMMSAQPMLESVLEEKSLRITEVLLGSANAEQLLMGKLLGNVGGSLTVFSVYATGAFFMASYKGYADIIPLQVIPWFVIYQVLAVLLFSSVFMAIGASVSQLKEAQSLLLPIWMVMMFPLMIWLNVVREPNGTLATAVSFFPPSTPLMMTLRLSTGAIIPVWQIALSIVILLGGTAIGVTAASRIYRAGILWQGKTPKFTEVIAWIFRSPAS